MPYKKTDTEYVCDLCGRKLLINPFSSSGILEIYTVYGWGFEVQEKIHLIPEQIIRDKFKGDRIIKQHNKKENIIFINCDLCILGKKRKEKILLIKEKMGII